MCKKLIYLLSLVFVLSMVLAGSADAADPNLQLWLGFENNTNDSSNYGRHGIAEDEEDYIAGVIGQAIDLDGNDSVRITGYKGITGTNPFSIAAWIRTTDNGAIVGWGFGPRGGDDNGKFVQFRTNSGRLRIEHGQSNVQGDTNVLGGEWHHVAVTVMENAWCRTPDVTMYVDGFDDTRTDTSSNFAFNTDSAFDVRIGREHDGDFGRNWVGDTDDLRIYDYELSAEEVRILSGNVGPILVSPADEALLTATGTFLKWTPGVYAANVDGHEVYFGTNYEDVNTGTGTLLGTTSGDVNEYLVTSLDTNKTYYWKVDAVNVSHPDVRWSSELWSFFVPPYEAYNPFPPDEQKFVDPNVTLDWSPGMAGTASAVYWGTNFNDVNTASGASPQSQTTYYPGPLARDANYYWRVDTIDAGFNTVKGVVWSFKTYGTTAITDPNLVGYWKLDNGDSGEVAIDSSGYDHYGRLRNGASYVAGFMDEAVQLDGIDDYISMDGYKGILGTDAFSVVAWINTSTDSGDDAIIGWGSASGGVRMVFRLDNGNATPFSVRYAQGNGNVQGNTAVNDGEWHHVAMTVESGGVCSSSYIRIYVDGRDDTVGSSDPDARNTPAGADVGIGLRASDGDQHFDGLIDEVRLYDRVLSPGEVQNMMDPSRAYGPSPDDRARDVPLGAKLIWNPGTDESTGSPYTKHNLYFSTNFEDVNAGTVTPIPITGANEYDPPLDYYNYYYWRVDEVNASDVAYRGWLWSFKATYNPALVVDPNLLAWYEFEGDATDSSGYGRDLTEYGEPAYTAGFENQAIDLDGDDDYADYTFPGEDRNDYTVTVWVRTDALGQAQYSSVFSSHTPNTNGFQLDVDNATPRSYRYHDGFDKLLGPVTAGWVHLAVTCNGTQTSTFYNGSFVDSNTPSDITFNRYTVGRNRNYGGEFEGAIDEVRIYDWVLPDAEIVAVMRIDLARAWMPNPGDGAADVAREPTLSWNPGDYAPGTNGHNVYFGADDPANMVLVSTPAQPQTPNNFDPGALDLGRTYYWAVDEVNVTTPGVNPGRVWSFTVVNYMVVDDFEGYSGNMWQIWIDGAGDCAGNDSNSGAILYEDVNTTYGGSAASMRYTYDNDGTVETHPCGASPLTRPWYSRGVAQLTDLPSGIDPNWLAGGAKALSLQFNGEPNNAIELLWVELEDGSANKDKVFYGMYDDEDTNDFNDGAWHEWSIALDDFTGVDESDVKSITIGIGDEGAILAGGTGIVYVDDIRLYPPRCFPLRAKPQADFSSDCEVGYPDLEILTDDWLLSAYEFDVAGSVSDANLEAHYEFEQDLNDSSVNLRHAVGYGTISYAAGTVGANAVDLNDAYAVADYNGVVGTQDRTVSAWIKTIGADQGTMVIVCWGSNTDNGHRWAFRINLNDTGTDGAVRVDVDAGTVRGSTDLRDGQWHHVAAVLQSYGSPEAKDIQLYADGMRDAVSNSQNNDIDTFSENDVTIGALYSGTGNSFKGQIDDLKIYSRALSHGEVAKLAGLAGTGIAQPLILTTPEDTDLFDDEIINFKDYARLLDEWLDEVLWP